MFTAVCSVYELKSVYTTCPHELDYNIIVFAENGVKKYKLINSILFFMSHSNFDLNI